MTRFAVVRVNKGERKEIGRYDDELTAFRIRCRLEDRDVPRECAGSIFRMVYEVTPVEESE